MVLTIEQKIEDLEILKKILDRLNRENDEPRFNNYLFLCSIVERHSEKFNKGFLVFLQNQLKLIDTKYHDLYDKTYPATRDITIKLAFSVHTGVWRQYEFEQRNIFLDRVISTLKTKQDATQKKNNHTV